MTSSYPRFPTIYGDAIVFTAEDDLWRVPAAGGRAWRLTAGVSAARGARFSPDGGRIAYLGAEEGPDEVHVVQADGSQSRRLTFEGATWCMVAGWSRDGGSVIYASNARSPHQTDMRLRQVDAAGGESAALPVGPGTAIAHGPRGVTVLAREYFKDLAHWKRYHGGTAGQLWIDRNGSGQFRRLTDLAGNLGRPEIVGERVYFLSDHEGHGNVYSLDFDGGDLRRHSDHDDFYARGLAGDGARLVYHCGGELYLLDPADDAPRRVEIHIGLTRTQRRRRFVDAAAYLDSVDVAPDGAALAVTTRGKAFSFAGWEGPVTQHGEADGVRYRLLTWAHGGDRLLAAAADTGPAEVLVTFGADGSQPVRLEHLDVGRACEIKGSPTQPVAAVANHRGELLLIDLRGDAAVATVLDSTNHGEISGLAFSPDGKWIAYARPEGSVNEETADRSAIMLAEVDGGRVVRAAERVLSDFSPAFDPDGKYLYFIGSREFKPVYDGLHFDLGFPGGARPYAVALAADTPPAFLPQPRGMHEPEPGEASDAKPGAADSGSGPPPAITVDIDGLARRVVPAPVEEGRYVRVMGIPGKLLTLTVPAVGGVLAHHDAPADPVGALDTVDLATGKVERIAEEVSAAAVTPDGKTLLYRSGSRLRLVKSGKKVPEESDDNNRASGWIDLGRVKVSVRPETEWPQMFREAWRLLGEQFWVEDMSGVDWDAVYARYAPLVERLSTRGELSDLIWELNGELGTSHAYERSGDYRPGPQYGQGHLGAEFDVAPDGRCTVAEIHLGDAWNPAATSPLNRPGVDVRAGDVILAVNGQPVDAGNSLGQRLVNQADQEISLTVRRDSNAAPHRVVVRALASECPLRYRDWAEANRRAVHEATGGRVGYIHIPDMGPDGYAEFHRGFLNEYDRDGLIVDVRYNGGGHVSALLLEKLARRRTGHVYARWARPVAFPFESPRGPMVAVTNEMAGSDGDIFSHSFRQMGLGPLVGTRTWGGVIGYYGWRPRLADGTVVTQPEISFHFDDVKWGVENYGVDPDVEIDCAPQDYAAGIDPQLDKAIEVVLEEMSTRPPHSVDFAERPRLAPPPLPPRPQHR